MQLAPRRWICITLLAVVAVLGAIESGTGVRDLGERGTSLHDELIGFTSADHGIGVVGAPDFRRVVELGVTGLSATSLVLVRRWSRRLDASSARPSHGAAVSVGLRAPPHPLLA